MVMVQKVCMLIQAGKSSSNVCSAAQVHLSVMIRIVRRIDKMAMPSPVQNLSLRAIRLAREHYLQRAFSDGSA